MRVPGCLACLTGVRMNRRPPAITPSKLAVALLATTVVVCHIACAAPLETATSDASQTSDGRRPETTNPAAGSGIVKSNDIKLANVQSAGEVLDDLEPRLSPAASRVGRIAERNGDRNFVMIDKARGQIIVFENGRPTFNRSALTGESLADHLPPDARYKPLSQQIGVKYKVTPAGRFTMTRGRDDVFGGTFDINELEGTDWRISIHEVWLGNTSQHRDLRLRSTEGQDKHITEGCIDVEPGTVAELYRLLPNSKRTVIYILPTDENLIADLFN
jgi:L,D-transpeptidase catalytic domain